MRRWLIVWWCCLQSLATFAYAGQVLVIDPAMEGETTFSDSCGEMTGTYRSSLRYTHEDDFGRVVYRARSVRFIHVFTKDDKLFMGGLGWDGLQEVGEFIVDDSQQAYRIVYGVGEDVQVDFRFRVVDADTVTVQGKIIDGDCTLSWEGTLTSP